MFGKICKQTVTEKPVYRLFDSCFSVLGAQVRPKDMRTRDELLATINHFALKNPEVKNFVKDLEKMDTKFLRLAADTMELASKKELLMTNINMNKKEASTGKSLLQYLLSVYPKAAKENPHSMELAQEVINNTDTLTSKYYLADFVKSFETPKYSQHYDAVRPMVKEIAEQTINGGYLGTFEKQKNFMDYIKILINDVAKPEKIRKLPQLTKAADEIPGENVLYLDNFVRSATPIERVEKNLKTVKDVGLLANAQGKTFDMVDFVNHNVNLD